MLGYRRHKRWLNAIILVVAAGLPFYFLAHALMGERGLSALREQRQEVSAQRRDAQNLAVYQKRLEREIKALNADTPDPDILEEHVRQSLGWSASNEHIFLDKAKDPDRDAYHDRPD